MPMQTIFDNLSLYAECQGLSVLSFYLLRTNHKNACRFTNMLGILWLLDTDIVYKDSRINRSEGRGNYADTLAIVIHKRQSVIQRIAYFYKGI